MRLSVRQEVAFNRIVTELRETAISEAVAEIELENMLDEMDEYLCRTLETSQEEKVLEERTDPCTMNDEVCRMLDEVERTLMAQNSDDAAVIETENITPVSDKPSYQTADESSDIPREESLDAPILYEKACKKSEHPKDMETVSKEEIVPSPIADMIGNETTFRCTDKPRNTQRRQYLSIFTKRNKNKSVEVMDQMEVPIISEKKIEKKGSFLTSLKRLLCCYVQCE